MTQAIEAVAPCEVRCEWCGFALYEGEKALALEESEETLWFCSRDCYDEWQSLERW